MSILLILFVNSFIRVLLIKQLDPLSFINQLKDDVVRFIMKLAERELYELMISKISKNLSVIRPDRKFFRQDRRNKTNKYPMNYKRMC
jgi:hypothetical protein